MNYRALLKREVRLGNAAIIPRAESRLNRLRYETNFFYAISEFLATFFVTFTRKTFEKTKNKKKTFGRKSRLEAK